MNPHEMTLREMLRLIEQFLISNPVANELWLVMSALRGPDTFYDHKLKKQMTIPIRRAAFPALAEIYNCDNCKLSHPEMGDNGDRFIIKQSDVSIHFHEHAQYAAQILGIL